MTGIQVLSVCISYIYENKLHHFVLPFVTPSYSCHDYSEAFKRKSSSSSYYWSRFYHLFHQRKDSQSTSGVKYRIWHVKKRISLYNKKDKFCYVCNLIYFKLLDGLMTVILHLQFELSDSLKTVSKRFFVLVSFSTNKYYYYIYY